MDRSRRSRFQERVRLEREFLGPVNAAFGSLAPLAGMTRAAIESWEARVEPLAASARVRTIAGILREASARAELLADNSKDVFDSEERGSPDGLLELQVLLVDALQARN